MSVNINIPASKSILNRAMILQALYSPKTKLANVTDCDDTKYMREGLEELAKEDQPQLYTGNAGTTTRFLTAYASLLNKKVTITGNERMQERPIQPLVDALNQAGAKVETSNGCPPVTLHPQIPQGGTIAIPANLSSQYISALMMISDGTNQGINLQLNGEVCSQPYIDMTSKMIEQFRQKPAEYNIETDASGASYFGAYATINPDQPIHIANLPTNSLQGDIAFIKYLEKMGCKYKDGNFQGPETLQSLGTIDMNTTPDLVMTFAVLAMFTPGQTTITNVANLRIKETDRLAALETEIQKFGISVRTTEDSITITGGLQPSSQAIEITTYDDHRIAMAFAIIKKQFPNLSFDQPECVNKSFPNFWEELAKL